MTAPLKVGLVGAGRVSRVHLPAYLDHDEVELTAVCDINEAAARDVAASAGVEDVFVDVEKMLLEADIDAVDICSAHDQHREGVLAAAAAGKHVLVEKAMGRSLGECREMVAATERAGVTFMVAQNLRYGTYAQAVKRVIDEGEIGDVLAVRCDGAMDVKDTLRPGDWILDGALAGGGTLITFSTHVIDLLRYYIGDVQSVTGVTRTTWAGLANGAEDYACATLEFVCGAIGTVFSTWTASRAPAGVSYTLYGERGALYTLPPTAEAALEQVGRPVVSSPARDGHSAADQVGNFVPLQPEVGRADSSFVNEILHFADCCRTGAEPISSGRDNVKTLEVIFGIYESARSRRTVDLGAR